MSLVHYRKKKTGVIQLNCPPILCNQDQKYGWYRETRLDINDLNRIGAYLKESTWIYRGEKKFYPLECETVSNFFEALTVYQSIHEQFGGTWNSKNPAVKRANEMLAFLNALNNSRRADPVLMWGHSSKSPRLKAICGRRQRWSYPLGNEPQVKLEPGTILAG